MIHKRSIWGGCKRSLYGAPEIWEDVRLLAKSINEGPSRRAQEDAEFLLAAVMCYAAYRVKLDISTCPAKVAICDFWKRIDLESIHNS